MKKTILIISIRLLSITGIIIINHNNFVKAVLAIVPQQCAEQKKCTTMLFFGYTFNSIAGKSEKERL